MRHGHWIATFLHTEIGPDVQDGCSDAVILRFMHIVLSF